MRILFLDDDPARTSKFLKLCPDAHIAEDAAGIIQLMQAGHADVVFLDHDLDGKTYVDMNEENTGSGVVRWIIANKPSVSQFIIHTLNYHAGVSMEQGLLSAGYESSRIPFTQVNWTTINQITNLK